MAWLAGGIFLAVLAAVATDRVSRAGAALGGAGLLILLRILDQRQALAAVDWNTLGLLFGMMVIVAVAARSGVFRYLAILAGRGAAGDPRRILIYLALTTAVASALLDNVSAVLFLTPITLALSRELSLDPFPLLTAQVAAANLGGTATLIGDPPNIMVGSAAGLNFGDFLLRAAPAAALGLAVVVGFLLLTHRHLLTPPRRRERLAHLDAGGALRDRRLVWVSFTVLSLTVVGFLVAPLFHYQLATVALGGAVLVLFAGRVNPREVLAEVDWDTLLFFMGLFVLVEGLVRTGVVEQAAQVLRASSGGSPGAAMLLLLWGGGVVSGVVNNVPFTAGMIPLVRTLVQGGMPSGPLWWSLVLGMGLGGNATLVGASANLAVASEAAAAGYAFSFRRYLPWGLACAGLSLAVATGYLLTVYPGVSP
ncbi:MAG: ArsB/NhaD family transporter [Thermaerobacter sp.]|jgi:Na+/H+ antiporter NhaD/arsenite permease-like protein|nr:ArsB/NhaD family transporter [Thermaerobacter sp.]